MTEPVRPTGSDADDIRQRLDALDQLYADGAISAVELSEGRRAILAGGSPAPTGSRATLSSAEEGSPQPTQPLVAAAPDSTQPATEPILAPVTPASSSQPAGSRLWGLPVWAVGLIGGLVALLALVLVVVLVSGGSDDADPDQAKAVAASGYTTSIKRPLGLLTRSASLIGTELATASEPGDLTRINRIAARQIDAIEESRSSLASVDVPAADARAHRLLMRAVTSQRTYVVALLRASDATPSQASLTNANRARQTAAKVVADYRAFFALEPDAPDAITNAGLTDTSGLRSAITSAIRAEEVAARREADAARRARQPTVVVPSSPGVPVANSAAEADRIFREILAGDFSDRAAADALYIRLYGTSDPIRGNAAFNAGVIRYANGDCSGAMEAFADAASVSGNATQNDIRQYAYSQAAAGCNVPVSSLIE